MPPTSGKMEIKYLISTTKNPLESVFYDVLDIVIYSNGIDPMLGIMAMNDAYIHQAKRLYQ